MKVGTKGSRKGVFAVGNAVLGTLDYLEFHAIFWTLGCVPSMLTSLKWPWHLKKRWVVTPSSKSWSVFSPVCIRGLFYRLTHHWVSSLLLRVIVTPPLLEWNYDVRSLNRWHIDTESRLFNEAVTSKHHLLRGESRWCLPPMVLVSDSTLLNTGSLDAKMANEPISIAMTGKLCWFPITSARHLPNPW